MTLNGEQLKQMSFRSKTIYVLKADWNSARIGEVCEAGGQGVLLRKQSTAVPLRMLHLYVSKELSSK